MTAISGLLQSLKNRTGKLASPSRTETAAEPEASLYHCSECETVYVAVDKNVCSNCDASLEQVRSTIA